MRSKFSSRPQAEGAGQARDSGLFRTESGEGLIEMEFAEAFVRLLWIW